jgi:ABC-2 type transport system permease protein
MTQVLVLHQLRFDLLTLRRNRRAQFFVLALPLLLLVTFAGLFGTEAVEVAGQSVAANRASVPGIMGLAVLTSSFAALTQAVVAQREAGILKRRRATPVPAAVLVVSRALAATVSALAACGLLVLVAGAAYGIDTPAGGVGALALTICAGSLCFACCGFAVAAAVRNADSAQPMLQVLMLPLQMISGVYFPISQLPEWLQHVAYVFPLAHLTDALQLAWLPSGPELAWGDLGVLALWAAGAAFVAARRFHWLPDR